MLTEKDAWITLAGIWSKAHHMIDARTTVPR
jgi:hypothetical protein